MPIVFALGVAGIVGLWLGGFPLQMLSSSLVAGSQSWVLLAIPTFVFAGKLMERCGMSHALVDLARALIGWVPGGLGLSVVLAEAVGIGLFLPPIGVGLLVALRFGNISVGQHFRAYWPYLIALFVGLLILIAWPE